MELWNLEHCENPDDSVQARAAQRGDDWGEGMAYASYAV